MVSEPLEGEPRLCGEEPRTAAATERQHFAVPASRETLAEEVAGIAFTHRTPIVPEPVHPS